MDTKILFTDRDIRLRFALDKYQKTIKNLEESIILIKDWLKRQEYIPEMPADNLIINFLLMNKFNLDNTQQKLGMYYKIRIKFPEFFENKHPSLKHMQETADNIYYTPLPKVTEEGYRVAVVKFTDSNPDNFQACNFYAHTYNVTEVRLHEDATIGDIHIYDLGNLKVGHFFKLTPMIIRKTSIILEKVYSNRIKQIHLLNCPKYASATISFTKKIIKPKIAARIHIHKDSKSIFKYVSSKIIPADYGGEELCLKELNELWKAKLVEYKERFDVLEKLRIKRDSKPIPLINDEAVGFHGNFRNLEVD